MLLGLERHVGQGTTAAEWICFVSVLHILATSFATWGFGRNRLAGGVATWCFAPSPRRPCCGSRSADGGVPEAVGKRPGVPEWIPATPMTYIMTMTEKTYDINTMR